MGKVLEIERCDQCRYRQYEDHHYYCSQEDGIRLLPYENLGINQLYDFKIPDWCHLKEINDVG